MVSKSSMREALGNSEGMNDLLASTKAAVIFSLFFYWG
jgi:hypothetical protein